MAERENDEKSKQECWKIMTYSEKVLLFLLVFTVLLLITAIVFIGLILLDKPNVCNTPNCIKVAADLLDVTDFTTDPCLDFHQFTCGNYVPLQEDCEEIREPRKVILGNPLQDDDGESLATAKRFYQACINVDESLSTQILQHLVSSLGDWPLILRNHWRYTNFHWLKFIVQKLRPRGIKSDWFFSFDYYVDTDGKNLLLIGPPDTQNVRNRYRNSYETMTFVINKLGKDFDLEDLTRILQFEEALENICNTSAKNRNIIKMNVTELNKLWPEIQLVHILNNVTNGYAAFNNSTNLMAHQYYLFELNVLLRATPPRIQINYLIWKIIESYLPYLSENFRKIYYEKYFEEDDVEDHCFSETMQRFYSSIESYMIKNKDDGVNAYLKSMTSGIIKAIFEDPYVDDPEVVIVGLEGENSGVTNFQFHSHDIIHMINEVHIYVENQFYTCLHKQSAICSRETYYFEPEDPEIRFDVNQTTLYLSFDLLRDDMYQWEQPNYISYARLGWKIADTIVEALRKETRFNREVRSVDLAYDAYIQATQEGKMDGSLPAIYYNIKQLFWIHSCTSHCKSENVSVQINEVRKSEKFKQDFGCL